MYLNYSCDPKTSACYFKEDSKGEKQKKKTIILQTSKQTQVIYTYVQILGVIINHKLYKHMIPTSVCCVFRPRYNLRCLSAKVICLLFYEACSLISLELNK